MKKSEARYLPEDIYSNSNMGYIKKTSHCKKKAGSECGLNPKDPDCEHQSQGSRLKTNYPSKVVGDGSGLPTQPK